MFYHSQIYPYEKVILYTYAENHHSKKNEYHNIALSYGLYNPFDEEF